MAESHGSMNHAAISDVIRNLLTLEPIFTKINKFSWLNFK